MTAIHDTLNLMNITSLYRYAGVLAVLVQIFTILTVGLCTGFDWFGPHPISDLGVSPVFRNYSAGFLLGAVFMIFFSYYLQKTFSTSRAFLVVFSIGIACEFFTGLAPDQPMMSHPFSFLWPLHLPAGAVLLITIPITMWLFAHTQKLDASTKKVSLVISAIYTLLLIPELLLIHYQLLYAVSEAVSLVIFDLWVIYLSLVAPRKKSTLGEATDQQQFTAAV